MSIKWNRRKYTESEFIEAWNGSDSIAECARKLNLTVFGSTYRTLKFTAEQLGLSREHMTGQAWLRGKTYENIAARIPLDEVFVQNGTTASSHLKKIIIREGTFPLECSAPFCPVPNPSVHPFTGETVPLKLALDHINGNNRDNRIENLRFLCYHCHGMTDTWCRGTSRGRPSGEPVDSKSTSRNKSVAGSTPVLCTCGNVKNKRSKQCIECRNLDKLKIKWPTLEELLRMVEETSYLAAGKKLGVSDNAVRKAIKRMSNTPY